MRQTQLCREEISYAVQ